MEISGLESVSVVQFSGMFLGCQVYNLVSHQRFLNIDDVVEQKLFKYRYRQNATDNATFERRWNRVRDRMLERAKSRDPIIE